MSQERFDKLEQSLDRIEKALVGDKAMGNLGIVDRLHEVERKTAQHDGADRHNDIFQASHR
jgi:hypothetical protein